MMSICGTILILKPISNTAITAGQSAGGGRYRSEFPDSIHNMNLDYKTGLG